ncbi:putative reverse transcriptase domain-containing protein [Tanacetum coccineum]|uniref:Reverse transcriptase domain-containing protein n=1 Tax=Tanacetum coccineum TaxID=301880 RepID=A0ABQ4XTI9_9ASTR
MPNDDERVELSLNSDQKSQSDSSHSYVPGGDVNTVDFPSNNSRNNADSSDGIFATQDEHIVDLLKDRKAIGSKWIFKIKYKSSGEIDRYKARLVAQGFGQKEGKLKYFLGNEVIDTVKATDNDHTLDNITDYQKFVELYVNDPDLAGIWHKCQVKSYPPYGFFLGKREAYPVNSDVNLLKKEVGDVPVWVKLYGVPMTAFSEDGLSAIATKIGTPLMLDSYTSNKCIQSWGRSSYARALIEVRADVELKDNIVVAMPKLGEEGFYTCNVRVEYEWKTPRCTCCKVFGHVQDECPNNKVSDVVKNMKKPSHTHRVENDVDLGTNGGTSNLTNKKANSSGSSLWNAESSSTSTTPIVEKIDKMKRLIIDGTATLVDDEGIPLTKVDSLGDHDNDDEVALVDNDMANFFASKDVGYGTNSLFKQWKGSYGNGEYDYDPYDNDMYEGHDILDKIQDICDNLDIKV